MPAIRMSLRPAARGAQPPSTMRIRPLFARVGVDGSTFVGAARHKVINVGAAIALGRGV